MILFCNTIVNIHLLVISMLLFIYPKIMENIINKQKHFSNNNIDSSNNEISNYCSRGKQIKA